MNYKFYYIGGISGDKIYAIRSKLEEVPTVAVLSSEDAILLRLSVKTDLLAEETDEPVNYKLKHEV